MPQRRGRYATHSDSSQKSNLTNLKRESSHTQASRTQANRLSHEWADPKSSSLPHSIQTNLTQLLSMMRL